ncbi:MAG: DUF952 domain-containing protein [Chloroflexota bacterium]
MLERVPSRTTYHLVPRREWNEHDRTQAYLPAAFAYDGFVHCTDGVDELAATANRYFSALDDDLLALEIDRSRLRAPVRYEDPRTIYPHVYGPIESDAILAVLVLRRSPDGVWLPPTQKDSARERAV